LGSFSIFCSSVRASPYALLIWFMVKPLSEAIFRYTLSMRPYSGTSSQGSCPLPIYSKTFLKSESFIVLSCFLRSSASSRVACKERPTRARFCAVGTAKTKRMSERAQFRSIAPLCAVRENCSSNWLIKVGFGVS
jgi:hypothetical protein